MTGARRPNAGRRGWLALLLVTVLVGPAAACGGAPDRADTEPLIILSGLDQSRGGQRGALIEEWNRMHRDRPAKIVELSSIADAQRSEMLARAQSGAEVDVYNLDVTWTAEFAEAGYLRPLDPEQVPTEGFLAGPLQTCRYDEQLWALPFNTDVGLLYYNKQLLGADQPPREWATLLAQAARVQRDSGGAVAGYIGQYGDYEGLTVTALELIWGARGDVIDSAGRVLPDPVAFQVGLDRLKQISPPNVPPYDEAAGILEFREGRALFLRNWPVADAELRGNPEAPPPDFGVTPLPERSAALGGQNLAVAATSTDPDAAQELVEFLTSERSETLLYTRGGLPATRAIVYDDPLLGAAEAAPLSATLKEALDDARGRPALPHYAQVSEAMRTIADGYLRRAELAGEDELRQQLEAAEKGRLLPG
jgi:multiple sugar transport system substrate-binding protein